MVVFKKSFRELASQEPPTYDGEEVVVVAEVFVFIGEDGTLVLTPPPCWAPNPGPTHAVEILPLTHANVAW